MVAAYSAFATLGTRATPTAIVRVENSRGQVLWEPTVVRAPVMSPEESWLMVSMMKDVIQRGTAAGSVGSQFRLPAGGKTGTTNDGADVWFIGYTPDLVAGVWMGLDKPQKIKSNAQGGVLAAPAWTAFMNEVYRRKPAPPDWPRPEGIVVRQIDPASGMLAGPGCAGAVSEYFIAGTDPTQPCIPGGIYGNRGVDTSFGFRSPLPSSPSDTGAASHATNVPPDAMVIPGATPIPRAARPTRPPRDSLARTTRDSARTPRDSARARRDTTNPFTIPPD
jgi:penicillin-binding protein 1A